MSASEHLPFTSLVRRLVAPGQAFHECQLWAFSLTQMGPCLSTLPFVALWALCELLRAWAVEGG